MGGPDTARTENLGGGISVCVNGHHTFGTDALLLARFAAPRRHETACDLGCGCGIIPLLWFAESRPRRAWALEIQREAVELAARSAAGSGLSPEELSVVEGDLRELPAELPKGALDLVTCNPPYKKLGAGVLSREESDQIARHESTCTLDDVCAAAARLLRYRGRLCICQLPERLPDTLEAMRRHRIEPKRLRFVQAREGTPPWLFLCEGKLGSKPFLQVEAPLLLQNRPGGFGGPGQKTT